MRLTRGTRSGRPVRARDASWYESPWRIIGRAVGSALAIIVLGALLALLVIPRLLGGDSLTVLSGSMEPTFSPGDVVVVQGLTEDEVCSDVSVGSIVTFFPEPNDPTLITHRVVGKTIGTFEDGTSCRLITQGDANSAPDEPVSPAQVRGSFMYGVPGVGWVRQWVGENPAIIGGIAVAVVIGWMLWGNLRTPKTRVVAVPRPTPTRVAAAPPREHALRERELELRERELELRERELAFAMGDGVGPDPAPQGPAPDPAPQGPAPDAGAPDAGAPNTGAPEPPAPERSDAPQAGSAHSVFLTRETRHDRANLD